MKRPGLYRVTIRWQLAALVAVVVLPLLGAIAYAMESARGNASAAAKRESLQVAVLTASSVQEFIANARTEMEVAAARPLVRRMDRARCDPFLKEAHGLNPYSANFTTVSLAGLGVCSALPVPAGGPASVADAEWFRRVRRSGRFTVGEPFVGRISHRRVAVLVLPVDDRGRRAGYVTMPIDLIRFQALFARLAASSEAVVTVVNGSGLVVARSLDAARYVGMRLPSAAASRLHGPPSIATGVDGVERVYARTPIGGTSWIVSSGVPTSVAFAASNRLLTTLLFVLSGLLALALLAAALTGRWIARPVEALARRARDIAEGRRPVAGAVSGPLEVVAAALRLDEMVDALWESEQQLSHVLDAAGMGAWVLDLSSGRMWRSARHDRIFGHPAPLPEWTLEIALAHIVPEDRDLIRAQFGQALETGSIRFECRIAWADGSSHWIRVEGQAEHGDGGNPMRFMGTVADVTERVKQDDERRQLEDQLRQSQKMEAVGQLAGGIAHDFNNLLTAISGYSEFALARLDGSDPKLRNDIEQIADAGERAAQLTRQLLAFSRRQILQPSVFDVNDAVRGSETLLRRLLGAHIDILSSLTPDSCTVNADRGHIEQILMNLAVNARDAMSSGGALTIETERVRLGERDARHRFECAAGEYVLLRVADTGSGMDADTLAHAFEPFFTTKPPGLGTGLGLATVFGIVRQNGGCIGLASEPGAGTTCEIVLPLVDARVTAPAASSAPISGLGTECVLLVEDDAVVRALTREMLSGKGYDVLTASDGEEALRIFRAHSFDLAITDMVMPKMSGKELAVCLRRIHSGLPVVFMSGYAYDAVGIDGLTPGDAFIQKPFSAHELGVIVRASLDQGLLLRDDC